MHGTSFRARATFFPHVAASRAQQKEGQPDTCSYAKRFFVFPPYKYIFWRHACIFRLYDEKPSARL